MLTLDHLMLSSIISLLKMKYICSLFWVGPEILATTAGIT